MGRKKGSKNKEIKQKQTQKQIVNVNINQPEKKKRKPREKKPKKEIINKEIIKIGEKNLINYGSSSQGKPSDNLNYSSPPIIAQVIPAISTDSNILLPPNNTNIESVLQDMKNKMDKLMKPEKKLIDSGAEEVLKMEPTIPKKIKFTTR